MDELLDDTHGVLEGNEERWEYDLPPLPGDDIASYWEEYMDEHYSYDICK